ncbi:glycine cleavage system transcriptional repressor, partial [Salmonella enterica subsp. enterica serovar Newport]
MLYAGFFYGFLKITSPLKGITGLTPS